MCITTLYIGEIKMERDNKTTNKPNAMKDPKKQNHADQKSRDEKNQNDKRSR